MTKPQIPINARLLKHMVAMTEHRDQHLLDASVVAALRELTQVEQARTMEVHTMRQQTFMRPRVTLIDGQAHYVDDDEQVFELVPPEGPLSQCVMVRGEHAVAEIDPHSAISWWPIWINDRLAMCVEVKHEWPLPDQKKRMFDGVIGIYRNFLGLLDYSERDSLTGLLNRKTFDENFGRLIGHHVEDESASPLLKRERRADIGAQEHWLAVVDIDHFKRINDQFGHLYGDEVLIMVANRLRSSFRAQDRVFRFGGEEFVILLRGVERKDVNNVFNRFRATIENHDFPQVGKVTVSIGFGSISGQSPVVILGHADQALYYAKEHGRNQVCHYEGLTESGLLKSETSNEDVEFFFE